MRNEHIVSLFIIFVLPSILFGQATGWRPPTPEELQEWAHSAKRIDYVRPNTLALLRINSDRMAKGLPIFKNVTPALTPDEELVGTVDPKLVLEGSLGSDLMTPKDFIPKSPSAVDNSALDCFPVIRTQGNIGSCAAFSSVYYTMTHNVGKVRGWNNKNSVNTTKFSPKFVYNMINGGSDNGSSLSTAYTMMQKHGCVTWDDFPYDSSKPPDDAFLAWCLSPDAWEDAIQYRMGASGYIYQVGDNATNIEQLKTYLANGWVCNYATYISDWHFTVVEDDPSTSNDDAYVGQQICSFQDADGNGGHAMTIVGYNDDIWCDINDNDVIDAGEKGAWKIANSWGNWKNAGFCWLAYDAVRDVTAVAGWTPSPSKTGAFWSDYVYTLSPGDPGYQPKLLAHFTLNHLRRWEIRIRLGIGDTSDSSPTTVWYPTALYYRGGDWAFDGTTTALDGVFVLDFTDLLPAGTVMKRYFIEVFDSLPNNPLQVKSFKLIDRQNSVERVCSQSFPLTLDEYVDYRYVDYNMQNGLPPVAAFTATPQSGNEPMVVTFNASTSSDPDGSIASYAWVFGDGANGSGVTATHTYSEGTYTAQLTVIDNDGNSVSTTKSINCGPDPNKIAAPTGLSGSVTGGTVTLNWTDNSNNETGFVVEAATNTSPTGSWGQVGEAGANATSWSGPISDGSWRFRIRGRNTTTGYYSPNSNETTVAVGGKGGGLCAVGSSTITIEGCHFDDDDAGIGGSVFIGDSASGRAVNCTFNNGRATGDGGAMSTSGLATLTVDNSIIWSTTASRYGPSAHVSAGSTLILNYSDWPTGTTSGSGTFTEGAGCQHSNPLLNSDGTLQAGSPCLDTGSDALLPAHLTTDRLSSNRKVNTVDMGAYERQ